MDKRGFPRSYITPGVLINLLSKISTECETGVKKLNDHQDPYEPTEGVNSFNRWDKMGDWAVF